MMKIIALTGPHNCGKTTTIISVYDMLKRYGGVSTAKRPEGANPLDFSDVVAWRGIRIAILSMGDFSRRINYCIDYFTNLPCDIFITACNNSLVTARAKINNHANKHIINKTNEPDCAKRPTADYDAAIKILNVLHMGICAFASLFAENTYRYLSRMFARKLGMAEIGITDVFVFELADFCYRSGNTDVFVYKTGSKIESVYGNDIDLFIQRPDGRYNYFTLQAKVMECHGYYKDLKLKTAPNQWDKLITHEASFGSKAFYLLYNGEPFGGPLTAIPTRSDCMGIPSISELGLGIVEATTVKTVREVTKPIGRIYMNDFFPVQIDAVRKLFCCGGTAYDGLRGYNYSDIYTGAPYRLIPSAGNGQSEEYEDMEEETDETFTSDRGLAPARIIVNTRNHE